MNEPIKRVELIIDEQTWFRQIGRNGQVITTSETYTNRAHAKRMAKRVAAQLNVECVEVHNG